MVTKTWSGIVNCSNWMRLLPALGAGFLCLLMAAPALAHPGSLWGIDLSSVVSLRDQARVMSHAHQADDELTSEELQRVRTVVLDPGHGGDNSGATGVAGIPEKQLTLELAYQLREKLQEKYPHLRVILTRYWDSSVELTDRVHLANLANADLFISLHYNAAPHDRAIGFETYFLEPAQVTPGGETTQGLPIATTDPTVTGVDAPEERLPPIGQSGDTLMLIEQDLLRAHRHDLSGHLAETIQEQFVDRIDSIDRGVKQANFAVLQGAHMPAVVVEAGFLTHPEEGLEVLTEEHRGRVTEALVGAVEHFDVQMAKTLDAEAEKPATEEINEAESEDAEAEEPATEDTGEAEEQRSSEPMANATP